MLVGRGRLGGHGGERRKRSVAFDGGLGFVQDKRRGGNDGNQIGLCGVEILDLLAAEKKIKIKPTSLRKTLMEELISSQILITKVILNLLLECLNIN
jgi:hypothetical protein